MDRSWLRNGDEYHHSRTAGSRMDSGVLAISARRDADGRKVAKAFSSFLRAPIVKECLPGSDRGR